jgi:hypothetical protein
VTDRSRWRRWLKDPWAQLVLYLLAFFVMGLIVWAFFAWVRGPVRSRYTPFNEGDPPVPAGRR